MNDRILEGKFEQQELRNTISLSELQACELNSTVIILRKPNFTHKGCENQVVEEN